MVITRLSQPMRYLIVTAIGVAIDLAIGWALSAILHVPVSIAALAGFLTAAWFNYVLHGRWTFRVSAGYQTGRRGALYLATLALTLTARMAVASLMQRQFALQPGDAIYALVPAVGISWLVGFFVSKFLVFRPSIKPTLAK